ncbi:hypothetical protein PoB_001040000 [Plakobranchus ocellatus]|uniref:Uncharacterized protein n=1 Tax=Plakobranchus ocellatus TaxID=259542 RepID=A0AAV3YME7_9GAST|nr:hypothetical protein PoB_001040000 [Plakobranchus ocellatus]
MAEEGIRSEEIKDIYRGLHAAVDGQSLQVTKYRNFLRSALVWQSGRCRPGSSSLKPGGGGYELATGGPCRFQGYTNASS